MWPDWDCFKCHVYQNLERIQLGHSEEYGCGLVEKGWEIGIVKVMGKEKKMVSVKVIGIIRESQYNMI